ncbi:MAG: DUF4178 domain-containing protein [Corynebacterium sp.]|nr:DUF4178 domain-containing protein [Corynebacterium sp.]
MAKFIGIIFLIIGFLLVAFAIYAFRKALQARKENTQQGGAQRSDPLAFAAGVTGQNDFNPQVLGPGAIINHGATDYVVRGGVTLSQGPFVWHEYMLDGGSGSEWLSVEVDEGQLELVLWQTRKDLQVTPHGVVQIDGITYTESERGGARYTTEGTTGLPAAGDMSYVDYEGPGDKRLGLESYSPNMPWEASLGHVVYPGEFTVFPAPPAS